MTFSLFGPNVKLYTKLLILNSFFNERQYLSLLLFVLLLITNENKKMDIFTPTIILSFLFQSIP